MRRLWDSVFGNVSARALRVWQRNADVWATTWLVNFIPPLFEPVLYVLAFGVGMGALVGTVSYQGDDIPYLRFMIPGVIAVAIMFWSYFETTYASFVRMYYQRTFDAILATPLLAEDVIAGEWVWGATKAVMASTVMLVIVGLFGLVHVPGALVVIPLSALGGLLFSALGLVTTALVPHIDHFNIPSFLVIFPMFLFSGTFFPIDVLPGWAMRVALALPLTHVSFLVRALCLHRPAPLWPWHLAYLILGSVLAGGLAIVLMRRRLIT